MIEFGYNVLNDLKVEKEELGNKIVEEIVNYWGNKNLTFSYDNYIVKKGDTLFDVGSI